MVQAVPEARLDAIERMLRDSVQEPVPTSPRRFASAGTLTAEPDLAERSEAILRTERNGDVEPDRFDG